MSALPLPFPEETSSPRLPEAYADRVRYMVDERQDWMWWAPSLCTVAYERYQKATSAMERRKAVGDFFERLAEFHARCPDRVLYEARTGCCGETKMFDEPLTDWTLVRCRRCGHFIKVR